MVRFIIKQKAGSRNENDVFTFQYGQIYYEVPEFNFESTETIYIPIWLDLLYIVCLFLQKLT